MEAKSFDKLIVIAPTMFPEVCGVSDYAMSLAVKLKKNSYEVVYLGLEREYEIMQSSLNKIANWKTILKSTRNDSNTTIILFNYTPTSYSRFGYPILLIWQLQRVLRTNKKNKLITIFHETWNDGNTLKMHHQIIGKLSKLFAKQLGKMSSNVVAMTSDQAQKLEAVLQKKNIHIGLVGANILPSTAEAGLISKRNKDVWIVFGLSHTRLWSLQKYQQLIQKLIASKHLNEIRLIGPSNGLYVTKELDYLKENFPNLKVSSLGSLSKEDVSKELLSAGAALISQTADSISKSGTFAAMAAHAVPVICDVEFKITDPLREAVFRQDELLFDISFFEKEGSMRAKKLCEWYLQTRNWDIIGKNIEDIIEIF